MNSKKKNEELPYPKDENGNYVVTWIQGEVWIDWKKPVTHVIEDGIKYTPEQWYYKETMNMNRQEEKDSWFEDTSLETKKIKWWGWTLIGLIAAVSLFFATSAFACTTLDQAKSKLPLGGDAQIELVLEYSDLNEGYLVYYRGLFDDYIGFKFENGCYSHFGYMNEQIFQDMLDHLEVENAKES